MTTKQTPTKFLLRMVKASVILWLCSTMCSSLIAASSLSYSISPVASLTENISVSLTLTSNRNNVATVGTRLSYDSTRFTLESFDVGNGLPGSWTPIYQSTSPGTIDIVLADISASASTINTPSSLEVLNLVFSRNDEDCSPANFSFNPSTPSAGPESNAYPMNHYIIYVSGNLITENATTNPATGPSLLDHSFIRGNVANRSAHSLDLQDVIDILGYLFDSNFVLSFDCDGALDVDNSGSINITDAIGLVQGLWGTAGFVIPPPNTVPGIGTADGGTIPSELGCVEGETCL